jgi:AsmA protein
MKLLKIAGYIAAGLVGLLVLGVGLVAFFFDPNDYKSDIERLVEESTKRKLTLQGDLHLSVFPWLAVRMGPATLSERTDTESFGSQPFVSLQEARLSVKVLPLLSGRVEIGNVQLTGPSIRLITDAQGRHNWDDLTGTKADAATPAATGSNVSATIAGLEIKAGEVVLDDRREKQRTALQGFSLAATGIGSGKPFALTSRFTLDQNGVQSPVAIDATVGVDWGNKQYELSKLDARLEWRRSGGVNGAADAIPIALRAETMSLDLAQQTLRLAGLQIGVGAAQMTGELSGTEIVDAPKLTGHVALARISLRDVCKQFNIQIPATRDAGVLKSLSFESDVALTSTSTTLQKMKLQLDDTTALGELAIADFQARAVRFDLDVDRIDFDRYLPPVTEAPATKAAAPQESAPTPIPVDTLRTLNARGKVRVGEAKFSGLKLSKVRIDLAARDGDVQLAPVQAALYGGTYQGDIALNVVGKQPRLALTAHAAKIDFAPLLKDMLDMKRISGRGNFNAKLGAVGKDTHAMLQSLDGTLDFNVADGAYEGMDLWYEIRRAKALLKQQPTPERTGAERTLFTAIQGTGVVSAGVMSNQDLNVAMQYLKVDGKGLVDLVNSTMDYRLNARVLRIPAQDPQAGEMQELVDAEIPITAKGPLASPKVRPDIEGYAKARAKQEVKKETDKIKEKLQDKLRNLLRG